MDRLLHDIQSQTIDLCTVDTIASFANIPYLFYYGNNSNKPVFMATDTLKDSLYTALLDFPILVGHLVMDGGGRAKVVVDKNNLNLPEFRESYSHVHFSDVQDAKFAWSALPDDGVATVDAITTARSDGVIRFVDVHVVRLRDNSGVVVFINIPHYVVDGVGFCAFVNRWAVICKSIHLEESSSELPVFHGTFSRSTIFEHLPAPCKPLDNTSRELYTTSGFLSKWLAWISPKTRGHVLKTTVAMTAIEGHVFHVSRKRLASLQMLVQDSVSNDKRITSNDVLTALITMAVAQSETECKQSALDSRGYLTSLAMYLLPFAFDQCSEFWTEIVCDARPRLPGLSAAQYTGNTVFVRCLVDDMVNVASGINAHLLAQQAIRVRQLVDSTNAQYIGQLFGTLNSDPSCFMCPIVQVLPKTAVVVSNQSRFTLYGADFGDGIPAWVSPIKTFYANFASILP
ncbi:hypothetical protein GGI21_004378, partial [Coemansia aciculifera]